MKNLIYPSGIKYKAVSSKEIDELCKLNKISFNKIGVNYIDKNGEYYDVEIIKLSEIPIEDKWADPDGNSYKRVSETEFEVINSIYTEVDRNDPFCIEKGDKILVSYFLYDNDGNKLQERNLTLYEDHSWYLE